jgi:hypothetical protein
MQCSQVKGALGSTLREQGSSEEQTNEQSSAVEEAVAGVEDILEIVEVTEKDRGQVLKPFEFICQEGSTGITEKPAEDRTQKF